MTSGIESADVVQDGIHLLDKRICLIGTLSLAIGPVVANKCNAIERLQRILLNLIH